MQNVLSLRRLNGLCDEFETAWLNGGAPVIEEYLGRLDGIDARERGQALRHLLPIELEYRRKRGEAPGRDGYLARLPDDADTVADVFDSPSIVGVLRGGGDGGNGDVQRASPHPAPLPGGEGENRAGGENGAGAEGETRMGAEGEDSSAAGGGQPGATRAAPRESLPRIDHYELLEEIARGGMGVVYKARQNNLNRIVALKMILSGEFADREEIERFRREAEAAANLRHPRIVPIFDVGEDSLGRPYYSMQYIEGHDLHDLLRKGPLVPREAAEMVRQIAEAVECAHRQGVIHRDLKPGNILLDRERTPHVADFGLARRQDSDCRLTVTGQVLGAPSFMAPEQARNGGDEIGPAADIYSLGAILYMALTGRPPFQSADYLETLRQVVENEPASPRLVNRGVPRDLETICLKCLEKPPRNRFGSAVELADELQRYLKGEPIRSRPVGRLQRLWRWSRRRPAAAALTAVSITMAMLLFAGTTIHNAQLDEINQQLTRKTVAALRSEKAAERQEQLARQQKERAEASEKTAMDNLYSSDMSRAASAWRKSDTHTLASRLASHIPNDGQVDRRGFEWWYLHHCVRQASRVLWETEQAIYTLCWSPDQTKLAAAGKDAVLRLLDPNSGEVLQQIRTGQVEVNGIAFSPDGTQVGTSGDDGTLKLWNLSDGAERATIRAFPSKAKAFQLLFSRDGEQIICCGEGRTIQLFDTKSGELIARLEGHRDDVQSIVLSADGRTLASASSDGTARTWDVAHATEIARFDTGRAGGALALVENRERLYTGTTSGLIQAWNTADGSEINHARVWDHVGAVAVHPRLPLLASGDRGGSIRLWLVETTGGIYQVERAAWQGHDGYVNSLVWSPDGARLLSAGEDGKIVSWEIDPALDAGPRRVRVDDGFKLRPIPRSHLAVVVAHLPYTMVIWDWQTASYQITFERVEVNDVSVSTDGELLAVVRKQNEIVIYPVLKERVPSHGREPLAERQMPWPAVESIQWSADSKMIAVAYRDNESGGVALLDFPKLEIVRQIPLADAKFPTFTPDGRSLAMRSGPKVVFWDLAAGEPAWEMDQGPIDALQISGDGTLIATAGTDRAVTVRSTLDGQIRFRLPGHLSPIKAIAFCPDGRTLASASVQGTIKLWNLATGQELFELRRVAAECRDLAFSDDGQRLLGLFKFEQQVHADILVFDAGDRD